LLGRAEEVGLLEGVRHLLLIPDGALQQLPPHVLVDAAGSWLVERHAVTIAPSVAAMLAARTSGPARSAARFAFLGIGDPVFSAFAMPARPGSRGPSPDLRSRLADLSRLADTADELRRIARILGAQDSRLLLREDASERGLLSARPEQYRVLALASHAVMAGELPGLAEPAVVLTADDDDAPMDGLLTASDVAALELNADLVLVSACNTAAPDGGPYAEGLSGLARSFLHAGARALLVSHWYVNSTATVELTTGFVAALQAAPHRRPAEALREGMHRMLTGERRALHHPAFWAPFVVVGG
jgi:CHAT domain-containing protein